MPILYVKSRIQTKLECPCGIGKKRNKHELRFEVVKDGMEEEH